MADILPAYRGARDRIRSARDGRAGCAGRRRTGAQGQPAPHRHRRVPRESLRRPASATCRPNDDGVRFLTSSGYALEQINRISLLETAGLAERLRPLRRGRRGGRRRLSRRHLDRPHAGSLDQRSRGPAYADEHRRPVRRARDDGGRVGRRAGPRARRPDRRERPHDPDVGGRARAVRARSRVLGAGGVRRQADRQAGGHAWCCGITAVTDSGCWSRSPRLTCCSSRAPEHRGDRHVERRGEPPDARRQRGDGLPGDRLRRRLAEAGMTGNSGRANLV